MIKNQLKKFAVLLLLSVPMSAYAVEDLSASIYNIEMDMAVANDIQTYMPEGGGLNPAYISSSTDPNLHLVAEGDVSVTYIHEGAGYKNSFGYFIYDDAGNILEEVTIFANASGDGMGGDLITGDTVDLGTFAEGTNIGFWVQADGYNNPNGNKYYSIDSMNPDGERHIAIVEDPATGQLVIGFEDLYNLGDADYNDMVFTVNVTPYEAIDRTNIPSGAPEPSHFAIAGIGLLALFFRRFASQNRNLRRRQDAGVAFA